jgi:drug/metabolite transporter (DMT)-like permease
VPGYDVRVLGDDGKELPSGQIGSIVIKLPLPPIATGLSGNHVIARAIAGHVPPGGLAMVCWSVVFDRQLPAFFQIRRDWPKSEEKAGVAPVMVGGTAFGTLQFVALQYTTALNMGVVGSVSPAFIVAASYILFRDRLGPSQLFGVGVSLVGVLAIVTQLDPERLLSLTFNGGDLIIIVNMAFWAVYCACLHLRPAVHPMSFLFAPLVLRSATCRSCCGNMSATIWSPTPKQGWPFSTRRCSSRCWPTSPEPGVDLVGAPRASVFPHTIPIFGTTLPRCLGRAAEALSHRWLCLILAGVTLAARPVAVGISRGP